MAKKKISFMKPVQNNGQVNSKMQFNVQYDTNKEKKIKPKQVFEYTSGKDNIKNRLRSSKKNCQCHHQ